VTCSCRWFFGKRKKKERWNKTDNKSGNGSRTAWVNEFLVAGAWQEPVPFNTAGHYPSARASVGPFRLPSTRLILSKSYAFVSLALPSWALGLPVLAASPDQPLACMAILLLVSQFKQTLTLQSLLCFCLCFSQSELPFPCHLSNPMATFVVDEPEMEGLVAADAAAVSQEEVAGAVAEPGRGGGLGGLGLAATSLAMAPLRSSGC